MALRFFLLLISFLCIHTALADDTPGVVHSVVGQRGSSTDGRISLELKVKRQGFERGDKYDADILSPKSVVYSRDGRKLYVNSLEGCRTVVYDAATMQKIKVISHFHKPDAESDWLAPSGFYSFTHYPGGEIFPFSGMPVECALSNDGKYLFVPYYRRSFDLNAQDPSALAIIDTETDEIVAMTETGPLPKMVAVSNDGRTLAITHWGDNTVGFLDISDPDFHKWHHEAPVTVGGKQKLNYSLSEKVDRDVDAGYKLRGTCFLPGDSLLLVSAMSGCVAVIDVPRHRWLGWISNLVSVRHIIENNGIVYFSRNMAGEVLSMPVDSVVAAVRRGTAPEGGDKMKRFGVKAGGLRICRVGGGARTIEISHSGRFLFAACNLASAIYVVDTQTMEVLMQVQVDSYPVGLDVSPFGDHVTVTSQGRNGHGGQSVNCFDVTYSEPEWLPEVEDKGAAKREVAEKKQSDKEIMHTIFVGALLLGLLAFLAIMFYPRKRRMD